VTGVQTCAPPTYPGKVRPPLHVARRTHLPWSSLVDSGALCAEVSGQGRDPGAGAAHLGMGGGRVGVWPQFQQQRVQVMGLLQAGRAGDPEGLGGLTPPDEQSPVAGLYLRGLMVFERVFGAVATQPGQTFGTPPTAGGVLTHGAGRADEGPAPRQRGPGPVQRITGGTGCR